ncbi:hypothetical protein EMPS_00859 [Entomortierella parvispora]|uniref:Calponin-homology (CH) domain-containing protein n=1 Tax=Entomortierella parvispora TaxID=205924 RepID=A0A9P3LS19_9FUNG|nr:hypothetical protein EMPS_00859 [Entomortierella parvispora]
MSALRFAEGYIKPRQTRQFASSAKKRASIRALGSITYLQRYYASGGSVGEGFSEEQFELARASSYLQYVTPRSGLKSPSPEVLLRHCHTDIQSMLEVWGIISYPHSDDVQEPESPLSLDDDDQSRQLGHGKESSSSSINSQQQHRYDNVSIDLLALLESSTRAISSIRKYSMHAPVLTSSALRVHRQAALSVIEMLSILEQENRIVDGEGYQPEGYCYARVQYGDLEEERAEMKRYLTVVQEHLFKPQADKIETPLEQLLVADSFNRSSRQGVVLQSLPTWIDDSAWTTTDDDVLSLDRCHAFLEFFKPTTRGPLPSPAINRDGFLQALSDGYIMCMVFNAFVSLTNMPFGVVDKIHEETTRTWRGADNWRFLMQACKFRLEFKIPAGSFKPIEIVKQTPLGREQLQSWVQLIVERGIQEAKTTLETKGKPESIAPPKFSLDF